MHYRDVSTSDQQRLHKFCSQFTAPAVPASDPAPDDRRDDAGPHATGDRQHGGQQLGDQQHGGQKHRDQTQADRHALWHTAYGSVLAHDLPADRPRSLGHLLDAACKTHGDRVAFTCVMPNGMNGSLSYTQLGRLSDEFAAWLRGPAGVQPGARVAVQMPNGLAFPVVALGVLKAGCVLVNTNPLYTSPEMTHQFRDAGAEVLVITDMFAGNLDAVLPQTDIRQVVLAGVADFFPALPGLIIRGVQKYWSRVIPPVPSLQVPVTRLSDALAQGAETGAQVARFWEDLGPDDLALLQYTGGTTGTAKGAMLSHANLIANSYQARLMAAPHLSRDEVILTALPMYHIFAFTVNFLTFLDLGARNILIPSPRPIRNLQRAIENYKVTWLTGVNTLFNALMNEEWFAIYPPRHLHAVVAGGTALHAPVAARWQAMTGVPVAEGYGLTEAAPLVCVNPLTDSAKPDSIGVPVQGTDVVLLDDDGAPVPIGQPGELVLRGPQVMLGYWNRPEDTAEVLRDGWLRSGDIAVMGPDGFLRIVDRKKDMVLVSGFNVYPNEVEDAILQMEAVLEAAVIGLPDPTTGEAVRAYVVKNPAYTGALSPKMVRDHCKTRLTGYKCPASVIVVEDLPKSAVGKIMRKDLRAQALKEEG
ncbi:AMP-binding protein [Roseicitreum antarcticum]|uniref:Long-chain-fatty-acid--CoA ligase n=1 Tax=Roseicitreum antarcticum TaxID=564137 RepID=A0A1H3A0A3_9RHOB|nr:AMP-binding protein [Roseicitreum antarcticum]SDX23046.1 long-chain acyl-CoA synthetase [Roseicitreum antarcticum]